ncbi:hypothetical protein SMJ63A_20101 [Stenotrophomonas geniculata]|nr:protein of unknown function [Stenotrophomonas maltophilia]
MRKLQSSVREIPIAMFCEPGHNSNCQPQYPNRSYSPRGHPQGSSCCGALSKPSAGAYQTTQAWSSRTRPVFFAPEGPAVHRPCRINP